MIVMPVAIMIFASQAMCLADSCQALWMSAPAWASRPCTFCDWWPMACRARKVERAARLTRRWGVVSDLWLDSTMVDACVLTKTLVHRRLGEAHNIYQGQNHRKVVTQSYRPKRSTRAYGGGVTGSRPSFRTTQERYRIAALPLPTKS